MSGQFEWVLTPSKFNERSQPLAIELEAWEAALKLSRKFGYAPPERGGMAREAVKWFAISLRRAVVSGEADGLVWVDRLLAFLEGEAKGGFTQAKQWKSWRRSMTTK